MIEEVKPTMMIRKMLKIGVLVAALIALTGLLMAQERDAESTPPAGISAVLSDEAGVYAGPSHTYERLITLPIGQQVAMHERNLIGNWIRTTWEGSSRSGGWLMIGTLDLPPGFTLDALRVNTFAPDADPSRIVDEQEKALYSVPLLPRIHPEMCEVYARAQEDGRVGGVISKVGDSNSASESYLTPISQGRYELGPYTFLTDTVNYFGASMGSQTVAARVGMNSMAVFDPFWANKAVCEQGESPIACEYRLRQPTIAVIMFGVNDTRVLNTADYQAQIEQLIEDSLAADVIPLLVTFTTNPSEWDYGSTLRFNLAMVEAAEAYNVPVINFWAAAQALYRAGVGDDNIHLTQSGGTLRLGRAESYYGLPLHNLLVLHALDSLRTTCEMQ